MDVGMLEEAAANFDALAEVGANGYSLEVGECLQAGLAEVLAIGIAVKGAVYIRAGVAYQLDFADLEFGAGCIAPSRSLAAQVVADDGRRQPLIGYHAMLDRMAQVD